MQTGKREGMCVMDNSVLELFQRGLITKEEAEACSVNREPYRHLSSNAYTADQF
mgnify:FL=1